MFEVFVLKGVAAASLQQCWTIEKFIIAVQSHRCRLFLQARLHVPHSVFINLLLWLLWSKYPWSCSSHKWKNSTKKGFFDLLIWWFNDIGVADRHLSFSSSSPHPPLPLIPILPRCLPRNICDPADRYRCRRPHIWQQRSCGLQHPGGSALLLSGRQDWYDCTHAVKLPPKHSICNLGNQHFYPLHVKSDGLQTSPATLTILWAPY